MISIKHLNKNFGNIEILKDVSAEINQGDVVSIIGPSGSGKSMLLRCINMLISPTDGQIFVDGIDVTDKKTDFRKIRRRIGMVFQSFNLFSHKMAVENVMMGPMDLLGVSKQEAFDEACKLLKLVGMGERIYYYPDELSGGQQQRVAIARCLAMKPEIILFDEPTSALDPTMVGEVQAVIKKLAQEGLTMMIVTHDMKFSREVSNRVFYMDDGTVYEQGTPDEIFDNPQRERTRAFVKRLKTMEYKIQSKDFDLYELNSKVSEFAKNNFISHSQLISIQLVLEELILNNILKHTENITIGLRYYEADASAELDISYGGEAYDPYENESEDVLSMLLVRQKTSDVSCYFDGVNHLIVKIENKQIDLKDQRQIMNKCISEIKNEKKAFT